MLTKSIENKGIYIVYIFIFIYVYKVKQGITAYIQKKIERKNKILLLNF